MIFEFKNLGSIKEAQIEMGNLTVICGKNNTGKTYLTYAVWGMLEWYNYSEFKIPEQYINEINEKGELNIDLKNISKEFYNIKNRSLLKPNKFIASVFSANELLFKNTKFKVDNIQIDYQSAYLMNNENWYAKRDKNSSLLHIRLQKRTSHMTSIDIQVRIFWIIMENFFSRTFLLTAQRDSVSLFYKELTIKRASLFGRPIIDNQRDILNIFSKPIENNLNFARDLTSLVIKTNSFLQEEYPELLKEIENILGVNFVVVGDDSVSIIDNKTETTIPDYMASTSVRSLLYLHFWLKHQAQKGDLLMIDEPELNLHPENQIKMARLFAKLVNVGIKVWITTHSDYIVKELNNLIMLSQSKEKEHLLEELKEYGYTKNDFLAPENVSFYTAVEDKNLGGCTVIRSKIGKYGIETPSFDETLDNLLYVSSKIENSLDD